MPRFVSICIVLAIGFLTVGCDQGALSPKNGEVHKEGPGGQVKANSSEKRQGPVGMSPIHRFSDVDIRVDGPLKPGSRTELTVEVEGNLDPYKSEVQLRLPEVSALETRKSQVEAGKALPEQASWSQRIGKGRPFRARSTVQIDDPGYYQVIASVSAQDANVTSSDGKLIKNTAVQTVWLWITESGGEVKSTFDRSLYSENERSQPGPLTKISEAPKLPTVSSQGESTDRLNPISDKTTINVSYINPTTGTPEVLSGARVRYKRYDGLHRFVDEGTEVIDENVDVTIPCYSEDLRGDGYYSGTVHVSDNSRLRVEHPQLVSDRVATFYGSFGTDCGKEVPVRGAWKMSHVFKEMSETIQRSRDHFEEERGKIHVKLKYDTDNSYYCSDLPIPLGRCESSRERIYIKDVLGDSTRGDTHIGGDYGDYVVSHEYGHALHQKGLGGNPVLGECPSPHRLN